MDIHKKTVRASLEPRREPYWRPIRPRCTIGYRKTTSGGDRWIAKYTEGQKRSQKPLGAVADVSWEDALAKAAEYFKDCARGVTRSLTVWEACDAYLRDLSRQRRYKTALDNRALLTTLVKERSLGAVKLDKLQPDDLRKWQKYVGEGRKAASVNRCYSSLKAALNFAYRDRKVSSDYAWKAVGCLPIPKDEREAAENARTFMPPDHRKALLAACELDLGALLRGLFYTGARPGDLRRACVRDYHGGRVTLHTAKGRGGIRAYHVDLAPDGRKLFDEQCRGRNDPSAPIFLSADGGDWGKRGFNRAFIRVLKRAELPHYVPYDIRHTTIASWLHAGIDVGTAAKMAGTSIGMIHAHYHKYIPSAVADKLAAVQIL